MHFFIHSSQTGKWLLSVADGSLHTAERDKWVEDWQKAKKYETPSEALNVIADLSSAAKAHIVLFDGFQFWNLSLSKAA